MMHYKGKPVRFRTRQVYDAGSMHASACVAHTDVLTKLTMAGLHAAGMQQARGQLDQSMLDLCRWYTMPIGATLYSISHTVCSHSTHVNLKAATK